MKIKSSLLGTLLFYLFISTDACQIKNSYNWRFTYNEKNCENCCIQFTPQPPKCVYEKPPCLVKLPVINYCRKKCPKKCCICCPYVGSCSRGWNNKLFSC